MAEVVVEAQTRIINLFVLSIKFKTLTAFKQNQVKQSVDFTQLKRYTETVLNKSGFKKIFVDDKIES